MIDNARRNSGHSNQRCTIFGEFIWKGSSQLTGRPREAISGEQQERSGLIKKYHVLYFEFETRPNGLNFVDRLAHVFKGFAN